MPGLKSQSNDVLLKKQITGLKSVDQAQYAQICQETKPTGDHAILLRAIDAVVPGADFQLRFVRSGWHRQAGIVTRDHTRISDDIRSWAEAHFDDDGILLDDDDRPEDYLATRLDGTSLYLVAITGPDPEDFVQVEIECLQEVTDHELIAEGFDPYDVEEFIDPPERVRVDPEPIGTPYYNFRRVTDVADLMHELSDTNSHNKRFVRFMNDWSSSSAGSRARFSDFWVLKLFQFTDRFGEVRTEATPIPTIDKDIELPSNHIPRGAELSNFLQKFDREHGYPMAWYFELLAKGNNETQAVIRTVHQDLSSGLDYLPLQDAKIIRAWFREPYCF